MSKESGKIIKNYFDEFQKIIASPLTPNSVRDITNHMEEVKIKIERLTESQIFLVEFADLYKDFESAVINIMKSSTVTTDESVESTRRVLGRFHVHDAACNDASILKIRKEYSILLDKIYETYGSVHEEIVFLKSLGLR